jgi:branched-chain amino acid transport system ATP-binding protein
MTITENLLMGAYTRKDKAGIQADIERMFGIFPRLKERKDQLAGTMSGGEQQMLAMARALMVSPGAAAGRAVHGLVAHHGGQDLRGGQRCLCAGRDHGAGGAERQPRAGAGRSGYVMESGIITMTGPGQTLLSDPRVRAAYLGE